MVDAYVDPREWTEFPPKCSKERLKKYEQYRDLLMGEHRKVFYCENSAYNRSSETALINDAIAAAKSVSESLYVSANYCKMASQIFANILFGDPPQFRIDEPGENEGESETQQERLDKIVTDNMLHITNHQQEIEASSLGDAVYRIRWGKMNNWGELGVVIEAIPAAVYFPIIAPGNIKDNLGGVLAFDFQYQDQGYLYKETYEPGTIRYELFKLDGNVIGAQVPLDTVPYYEHILDQLRYDNYSRRDDAVVYQTDYPGLFIEHVPNWTKPDQYFGISDYSPDVISNQGAINAIKTGILQVCLKHMDPKLVLPPGLFKEDRQTGRWYIEKEDLQAIEVDGDVGAVLPRYVTWDAKLDAASLNVDECFQTMMMSLQISPAIFGWEKYGQADSAAALKLRMTITLWMVGQKRMYFEAALKNILYAAQYLDGRYGAVQYEPLEVSVTWPDPLPTDEGQEATALETMRRNNLISLETAVARIQNIEGEALAAEMARIQKDNRAQLLVELSQLAVHQAISPDAMLRVYRGESVEEVLGSAEAPKEAESTFPAEE